MADIKNAKTNVETTGESNGATAVTTAANLVALLDSDKVKKINSELGQRTTLDSDETATAAEKANKHLEAAMSKTEQFFGLPVVVGQGVETASRIVIATVGVRDKGDASAKPPIPARNGIKAIVVFQQPTIEEFLTATTDSAKAFVAKLIEREATDVAFSGIRAAETLADLEEVMTGLPITVDTIVETSRTSSAGASSFDIMWSDFRKGFVKAKYPQLDAVLPQKPEIIKAIRSKAFALANPATAEIEKQNLFVRLAGVMVKAAETWKDEKGEIAPIDTSDLQSWIDNRESTVIEYKTVEVKASDLAGLDF